MTEEYSNKEMLRNKLTGMEDILIQAMQELDHQIRSETNIIPNYYFDILQRIRAISNEAGSYVMAINREQEDSDKKIAIAIKTAEREKREREEAAIREQQSTEPGRIEL